MARFNNCRPPGTGCFFFLNNPPPPEISPLPLPDALPIYPRRRPHRGLGAHPLMAVEPQVAPAPAAQSGPRIADVRLERVTKRFDDVVAVDDLSLRSEEHTSELQSQSNLVCRLLLEKKKTH